MGLPNTSVPSSSAVLFTAMQSITSCIRASSNSVSATCILFCVSVPVLSVQMTVVAPIVSQACILRTRLLVFSIRRME